MAIGRDVGCDLIDRGFDGLCCGAFFAIELGDWQSTGARMTSRTASLPNLAFIFESEGGTALSPPPNRTSALVSNALSVVPIP